MDKQEFNKLEVLEQLNYINSELIKGESLRNIADILKMSKTTFRDRALKIGYVYNANTSQYNKDNTIVIEPLKSIVKVSQKPHERVITTLNKGNTKELQKYDNTIELQKYANDILELINYKDELLEMLKNYKSNTIDMQELNINSLPQEIQKDVSNKSIKIYDPVYKMFNELCDTYGNYKKQDLISLALYEFYNKYKKK